FKPDIKLFKKFRGYLLVKTQVNWVYYSNSNLCAYNSKWAHVNLMDYN
ncbi:TPA: capsular biosynthesis protein, partial [Escherichia coli]